MANPNPFLFGVPPAGGAEPPNPFLGGADPSAAANPFGVPSQPMANPFGGMGAPVMNQPQPQYGAYGTPQPIADASNPFASFGAPAPPARQNSTPFGDTSAYYPQSMPQQQPQHQQHYGQFGQYSQAISGTLTQPNVTASFQPPPVPPIPSNSDKVNPFATAIEAVPLDQTATNIQIAQTQAAENPPSEKLCNSSPFMNGATAEVAALAPSSQDEIPPPPPLNLMQEDTKILPEQSTEETLPPPPLQESITEDGPLPPPPGTADVNPFASAIETAPFEQTCTSHQEALKQATEKSTPDDISLVDTSITKSSAAEITKQLDGAHIDNEKPPEISVDSTLLNNISESNPEVIADKSTHKGEGSGFGGIFSNDLLDTGDTMKAAVSVTDLAPEATETLDAKIISTNDDDASDAVTDYAKEETSNSPEDITVKANSIGASLFGGTEEPVAVSTEGTDYIDSKNSISNQKPDSSSSSSEVNTPQKPTMSTGDAIFANMNAEPEAISTGAAIFGMSDESAKDSTGAAIFGVAAPRSIRPQLGQMTGWDDAFDKKFDTAITQEIGDAFDPFGDSGLGGDRTQGFGAEDFISGNFPTAPSSAPGIARREDAFGQAPMTDDLNNPFLTAQKPMGAGQVDEACDGPLYDDDTTKPLQPFPRLKYDGPGWEMYIRHPPKKKLTAQRFWKKVFVRLVKDKDNNPCVQLFETKDSKDAFQELPLEPAYSVSDIGHQVFDQYSKLFTLKLQYIFYKEQAGIRPGQITKVQKLTGKIGFLAKAVEDADLKGVKEFASDIKKLGIPLEHSPQVSELLKLASTSYEDLKQFTVCFEEIIFRMPAIRDKSLTYKTEEVQMTAVDEVYVEQNKNGTVLQQIARVRCFFISFLSDMPEVEVGVNDITRMGLEVCGRHDILPVPTEQWIRYENIEFHPIVDRKEFEKNDHIIKFQPPDACYLELFRFRVRPPRARELPMQARCNFIMKGTKVEIRADMMIPYHHTKAFGQVPCEDVSMRIPIPEAWIYLFRTEKAHVSLSQLAAGNLNLSSRMGSVKSAHRRAGKVKGLERFLGTLETQKQELMETSSGEAKYEHQHKAIVWRVPRLPKHGQGSYTNHEFVCKLQITSGDQMPETFDKNFYVEFTQPATCVSHTVLRSVSILGGDCDEPPEKSVKYLARHEYKLEIDFTEKEESAYKAVVKKAPEPEPEPQGDPDFPEERPQDSSSDSD